MQPQCQLLIFKLRLEVNVSSGFLPGMFGSGSLLKFTAISKEEIVAELKVTGNINPWNMTISGYDTDPRSLPMIPEVVAWYRKVHAQHPYFAIFLSAFSVHSYVLSQLDIEVVGKGRRGDIEDDEQAQIEHALDIADALDPGQKDGYRPQFEEDVVYGVDPIKFEAVLSEISLTGAMFLAQQKISSQILPQLIETAMERVFSAFNS